jgi:hypothetical protein
MAIINEIQIGAVPKYNGMTMFRKYNSELGFMPYYKFINDNTLSTESKIIVNYIEYFKNEDGTEITELRKYKNYIVPNHLATYKQIDVELEPAVYYQQGEVITPASFDENGNETSPAVIAAGTEIKTPAIMGKETVEDKPAWLAANGWFMSIARTPITAQTGIMDGIEYTLQNLPIDIPNGYILQQP